MKIHSCERQDEIYYLRAVNGKLKHVSFAAFHRPPAIVYQKFALARSTGHSLATPGIVIQQGLDEET